MKRIPIIAGNWKMYKTQEQAEAFITALIPLLKPNAVRVFIAPPFTAIDRAVHTSKKSSIVIGAQNMHPGDEGAFTGEVSPLMLKELGAQFVILGHSERRALFHETDHMIHQKVKSALKHGLTPILCIGETQSERDAHHTKTVLKRQLSLCLEGISAEEAKKLIIAYEPVWAIGTGKSATPLMAQEEHGFCRALLQEMFGDVSERIPLLYGGSVKPETIQELMQMDDIDGALVGGASLKAETFAQIINHV